MKRIFDIVFSIIGLLVFSLPIGIVCLLIKCWEHHPILFKQTRIGKAMKPFPILKIQTMVDDQVTPVGRIIRATGLDEVPQFINVLQGDMSIVGPRALTIDSIREMNWDDGQHNKRWSVKPGITGFAQLSEKYKKRQHLPARLRLHRPQQCPARPQSVVCDLRHQHFRQENSAQGALRPRLQRGHTSQSIVSY